MLHRRRRRRQFFVDVSWESTGEVVVGQVKELKSRAAVERRRELAGEVVVGKVEMGEVLEVADGSWDWIDYVELLEGQGGHLAVDAPDDACPAAVGRSVLGAP